MIKDAAGKCHDARLLLMVIRKAGSNTGLFLCNDHHYQLKAGRAICDPAGVECSFVMNMSKNI